MHCSFAVWTLRAAIGQNVPVKGHLAHHIGFILFWAVTVADRIAFYKDTKHREAGSLVNYFVQHVSYCRSVLADLLWNIKN